MILDKYASINITSRNITYYISKNYDIKVGDFIDINISDLHEGSTSKLKVACDNCKSEYTMEYRNYNKNLKKYNVYFCNKCKNIKSKRTKLILYGDENYNNIEKNKKTCIEKYGVEHYNKLDDSKYYIKNKKLELYGDENYNNIEKVKKTKKIKYGSDKYNNIEKIRKTCIDRYGYDNISKVDKFKEKAFLKRKQKLIEMYSEYGLLDVNYENYFYICKCNENDHQYEIPKTIFYNRIKTNTTLCTICNPVGISYSDKENLIYSFIKDNYNNEIIKNSRDIIKPLELDIYLPDINVAFEFNGIYWHSEIYKPNNYHLLKTEMCDEKGIKLIHIYEDDWQYKQEIVKSMILNILNKNDNKIYARKCTIKEINNIDTIRYFLDKNHIQGFVGGKIKIGLYYNNDLVSLMMFGNLRKSLGSNSKNNSYELLRFCNKLNTNVVGGASKLFKYFIDKYNPNYIITYADRSYSQGKLYYKLGFNFIKKTSPNYYYLLDNIKLHRFNFRKDRLIKEGYDPTKTEHEIMLDRKIYRIYDSGNLKFIYDNKKRESFRLS